MDTTVATIVGISPAIFPNPINPSFELKFMKNKIYGPYKFGFYCSNYERRKNFNDNSYTRHPPILTEFIEIEIVASCTGLPCLNPLKITESE